MPNIPIIIHRVKIVLDVVSILGLFGLSVHLAMEDLRASSIPNVQKHFKDRTILVVAHPDDETMFFGPTLLNLIAQNKSVSILCLSNGNADHIGSVRELELANVVEALGPTVSLSIVTDANLQDNMTSEWAPEVIQSHIEEHITKDFVSKHTKQTILSFDDYGISGHPNHRSIYKALVNMKDKLKNINVTPVNILVLRSVDLLRKYSSLFDSVITRFQTEFMTEPHTFTLSISLTEYKSLKQLLRFHHSQMVWFRDLYTIFSRYMFINDLEQL